MSTARLAALAGLAGLAVLPSCVSDPLPPPDPQAELVARGEQIFFNETFGGNGRTCGTCHPAENDFTLDPAFIASLPGDDPLFVAEFDPNLAANFENPRLMREFGLILENLGDFDDLERRFVLRGVPHTLALATSIGSPAGPRLGWSGDGSPGDGSLRSFATGAVRQHFTKTLNRVPGVDFRLPTDEELDALEAFQFSLGRRRDPPLPLPLRGTVPRRGQEIFLDDSLGKCNLCHANAGANSRFPGQPPGNGNFDTGVEALPDQPADLTGEEVPPDDGFGRPGDGTFNTPPLVESADTGPFFHNNSIETIEGAVAFYDGEAFNQSPAGRTLASLDPEGASIELDGTQIVAIAAFLRVINGLENIRGAVALLQDSLERRQRGPSRIAALRGRAAAEIGDAIRVLGGGGLHPEAVLDLERARRLAERARKAIFGREWSARQAIRALEQARDQLVEPGPTDAVRG